MVGHYTCVWRTRVSKQANKQGEKTINLIPWLDHSYKHTCIRNVVRRGVLKRETRLGLRTSRSMDDYTLRSMFSTAKLCIHVDKTTLHKGSCFRLQRRDPIDIVNHGTGREIILSGSFEKALKTCVTSDPTIRLGKCACKKILTGVIMPMVTLFHSCPVEVHLYKVFDPLWARNNNRVKYQYAGRDDLQNITSISASLRYSG